MLKLPFHILLDDLKFGMIVFIKAIPRHSDCANLPQVFRQTNPIANGNFINCRQ